jgi:ATP-dependent Clp protease ATP-binding subunit ClpA
MYSLFSDQLRTTMLTANRLAGQRGRDYVSNLDIVSAILESDPALFSELAVDVAQLKSEVEKSLACNKVGGGNTSVKQAAQLAVSLGAAAVSNGHLLAGLLTEPEEAIEQLFGGSKSSCDQLRALLLSQMANDESQ